MLTSPVGVVRASQLAAEMVSSGTTSELHNGGLEGARAGAAGGPQVGTLQLHGTGTALGDPIEVNAALAALLPPPGAPGGPGGGGPPRPPLQLSAAKAAAGHAEAAAGVVGFAAAALVVEGLCHPSVLHLRFEGRPCEHRHGRDRPCFEHGRLEKFECFGILVAI